MERGLKIALASGVLLTGATLALMFRHQSPRVGGPAGVAEQLVLRGQRELPVSGGNSQDYPIHRGNPRTKPRPAAPPRPMATILTPRAPTEPPPVLARDYPHAPDSNRWGTSIGMCLPAVDARGARRHIIEDGDTLETLAEQYLGDAGRAGEIHDANRNVLTKPDVLPIGVEIVIPPRRPAPRAPLPDDRSLVPVDGSTSSQ